MVKKVYPQINEYLKKSDIDKSQISGIMEVYKGVRYNKKIEIIVPLDNQVQFLSLYDKNPKN